MSVVLDRPGRPTFAAWTRCGSGHPGWRLFEKLGSGPVLSYVEHYQDHSLLGDQPEWIKAILPIGKAGVPLVLAQVFTGTTGNALQIFAVNHGTIERLTIRRGPNPDDFSTGGAVSHGQGLVCTTTSDSVQITQTLWGVTGTEPLVPVSGASVNPASQPIRLTTQTFSFGGTPVRLLRATAVHVRNTTYAVGTEAEKLAC